MKSGNPPDFGEARRVVRPDPQRGRSESERFSGCPREDPYVTIFQDIWSETYTRLGWMTE